MSRLVNTPNLRISTAVFWLLLTRGTGAMGEELTLKECLEKAISQNPLVAESALGVAASEEGIKGAWGRHYPRLSLDANYSRREDPVPFIPAQSTTTPAHFSDSYGSWSALLVFPLYQGGQVAANVELARVRRDLQRLFLAQTRNDLIANTVNTYHKLLQLQQFREASRASTAALAEQVKNALLLFEVERIAKVDLLKVKVQLANEEQRLLALDEAIATTGALLRYLMGEAPTAAAGEPRLADHLGMPEAPAVSAETGERTREARPEYQTAKQGVREAHISRRNAVGTLLPSVNALASYTDQFGLQPWYEEPNWALGLQVSLPLFDRSLYADLSREGIQQQRAQERLRAVTNQLALEFDTALASMRESSRRVETAQQVIEQARESFRIEQEKYGSGAGAMSDLLLAQAAESMADANLSQALFDYNAALVAYHKATGTLEDYLK
ncbi:MAG: TolC family protein [Candidatus Latescibacteria bacterium]|nr:TolC family protein [Candidatus Latescibacterota bacterium]